jgi:ACS family tartrate transporter-like MFS transporter
MPLTQEIPEVGNRARRRIALRLLPFVFILYVIAYIDRVNVSFASLKMNAELGLSDSAFGLGSGMFYISYVLFEIPGALIVERWSARKWIGRIMITWGAVTIGTGFIHTGGQFYLARFLLGFAEASFFPGMIVYLTRWFSLHDRSRAIACLYAANPGASLIGSPIAGWLLGVHWPWLAGWRWLFVMEGIPAIVFGVVTLFYLTDWPAQARWLPIPERDWLNDELGKEFQAKKKIREYTILQAFSERRILLLILAYFLALTGSLGTVYWIPTFIKRLTGLPLRTVTLLLLVPALMGVAGILVNGWHSDKTNERRRHAAIPLLLAGLLFFSVVLTRHENPLAIFCLLMGSGSLYAYYPAFWSMPTMLLTKSAAAATFGLINSVGLIGGLVGPWAIGFLNDRTHSLTSGFALIALVYIAAGSVILSLRVENPLTAQVPVKP